MFDYRDYLPERGTFESLVLTLQSERACALLAYLYLCKKKRPTIERILKNSFLFDNADQLSRFAVSLSCEGLLKYENTHYSLTNKGKSFVKTWGDGFIRNMGALIKRLQSVAKAFKDEKAIKIFDEIMAYVSAEAYINSDSIARAIGNLTKSQAFFYLQDFKRLNLISHDRKKGYRVTKLGKKIRTWDSK